MLIIGGTLMATLELMEVSLEDWKGRFYSIYRL